MKKTLILLAGVATTTMTPASAMILEERDETVISQKATVSQVIKNQIQNVKKHADELIQNQEPAYLMVGAANIEIKSLKNTSMANNWLFWNYSAHEG